MQVEETNEPSVNVFNWKGLSAVVAMAEFDQTWRVRRIYFSEMLKLGFTFSNPGNFGSFSMKYKPELKPILQLRCIYQMVPY